MSWQRDLRKRLLGLNESSYLSLMSIVQGVALGFLAVAVVDGHSRFDILAWTLAATTLLLIILTWNEYVVGVAVFEWAPTLIDSTIPFLLCATEVWLATAVANNPQPWLLAFSVFAFVATLAFGNQYWRASREKHNRDAVRHLKGYLRLAVTMPLASALASLWFAQQKSPAWRVGSVGACVVMVVAFVIRTVAYRQRLDRIAGMAE